MDYTKWLYSDDGHRAIDTMASNHKLCSNFFNRLCTQRMAYSLGNGVTFAEDSTKERLGIDFDTNLRSIGYYSIIHGVAFAFWNMTHLHVFPVTEFAPLWDEQTSQLRGGVRFWQIDPKKPMIAILYEEDGYTRFEGTSGMADFKIAEDKHAYKVTIRQAAADAEPEVISIDNYNGNLPIIPFWGSRLHQSAIVGIQSQIDAFDLIRSGFCNDLADCSEVYWIVSGTGGATDSDLAKFRDRLKFNHIAAVTDVGETPITPYSQPLPYEARKEFLNEIRNGIYEDFGALDVHAVAAGATNDHIDAAYQPMDENADDFEYQIISGVQAILRLIGVDDTPLFKRNRISNQKEMTEMIIMCVELLGRETALAKLPFVTPDEVNDILDRTEAEDAKRLLNMEVDDEIEESENMEN